MYSGYFREEDPSITPSTRTNTLMDTNVSTNNINNIPQNVITTAKSFRRMSSSFIDTLSSHINLTTPHTTTINNNKEDKPEKQQQQAVDMFEKWEKLQERIKQKSLSDGGSAELNMTGVYTDDEYNDTITFLPCSDSMKTMDQLIKTSEEERIRRASLFSFASQTSVFNSTTDEDVTTSPSPMRNPLSIVRIKQASKTSLNSTPTATNIDFV